MLRWHFKNNAKNARGVLVYRASSRTVRDTLSIPILKNNKTQPTKKVLSVKTQNYVKRQDYGSVVKIEAELETIKHEGKATTIT